MASIDQNGQSLSDYLLKVLTVIVRKAGGELRIAAVDMIDDNNDGLIKEYDRVKKELVLRYISSTTEVIRPCLDTPESPSLTMPQRPAYLSGHSVSSQPPRSSILRPLVASPQMDSSTSPLDPDSRIASTLDDERIADLEDHLRKQAAAKIIANFPGTPVTAPRSQPLRPSSSSQSQPSPSPRRVQPSFYRD